MTADSRAAVAEDPAVIPPAADARLQAFCSAAGPEVFHSIARPDQIWSADPFDVDTIHQPAREIFQRLLLRATMPQEFPSGRILLLKGESGSGKTHLMRAFRNYVHGGERGYCGYLQMTSQASNYAHYVLAKLIDALDRPYFDPEVQTSSLMRLSLGLLEAVPGLTTGEREGFQEGEVPDLAAAVEDYADRILADSRFHSSDLDLIRALLFLQRNDARIKMRVLKWLRCEEMSAHDRVLLGDLVPRTREECPQEMIAHLGQLMGTVHAMPLVLCVDQLEDMATQEAAPDRFRRVMHTLVAIAEEVPSSVVVISCLEDYYAAHRQYLTRPKLDRIESDPEPIRLAAHRGLEEVEALVSRRLHFLYEDLGVDCDGEAETLPFTRAHLERLVNMRTRDVLDFCRCHREKCLQAGAWVEPEGTTEKKGDESAKQHTVSEATTTLEQSWNDFRVSFKEPVPDEETALAGLLAWAVRQCSEELPADYFFGAEAERRTIPVEAHSPGDAVDRLLLAVCDRRPQGGGLGNQIREAESTAGDVPLVVMRSTAFPASPTAAVSKHLAAILKRGGRRVVIENADWRTMLALRQFQTQSGKQPAFAAWLRENKPLSQLASLRHALGLDTLVKQWTAATPSARPTDRAKPTLANVPAAAVRPAEPTGPLLLGTRAGLTGGAVTVEPGELTQHAAFLGGSGSGKTTVALNLIEQLLERGIPAVLLDRKGDLCRYADPTAWQAPLADPQQAARRQRLRERLVVSVFTPGNPAGRALNLPVVPEGMDQLPTHDREQLAGYAAAALGGMLNYKPRGTDQKCQAILRKAIEVMASVPRAEITLPALRQLIEDRDDALLQAVGGFDDKLYKKLAEDLLALWLNQQPLLAGAGERLDIGTLLGRDGSVAAGKVRLSVISTRFLHDQATVDFWVAQFLVAIGRWMGKHSANQLQAVFFFDEADQYLPAQRQPATKAPMENLLKRARSAGVGLLLATQSPGDFDYKCRDTIRTWLVGRVKEQTALNKLKPMFAESRMDVAAKLPGQGMGQFHLLREKEVCPLRTQPSLIATEQLPEEKILELARNRRGRG